MYRFQVTYYWEVGNWKQDVILSRNHIVMLALNVHGGRSSLVLFFFEMNVVMVSEYGFSLISYATFYFTQ